MNEHDSDTQPGQGGGPPWSNPGVGGGSGGSAGGQAGSQWGGPTAGGAAAPNPGQPIPLQAPPLLFKPEAKRRGGPSAFGIVFAIALVLCVGGVAFAAGRLTAPAAATTTNGNGNFGGRFPNASPGAGGFGGANGGFGGGLGGGLSIQGTVSAVAADGTISLKLTNGTTLSIATNGQTTYHTETAASQTAVAAGTTIRVSLDGAGLAGAFRGGGANGGATASGAPVQTATDILVVTP